MGVFRLESFYEHNCSPKVVNIQTLLEEYRKENNFVETATIVVDGTNCLRTLYGDLDWIAGGQLKEFHERVNKLLDKFKELNVKLVFFFDGPTVEAKRPRWVERRLATIADCRRVFYALETGRYVRHENFILPPGVGNVARLFLKLEYGCEVHTSVKENDEEIALYAKKNNCFGILAQDTDFLIYGGAKYYFSAKKLNLNTMETILFDREKLAETLSIKVELLPLFSTLSGNDIMPRHLLQELHHRISKKNHYKQQIDIANYIKSLEIEGEITDEMYKKIAADILYKKPRVKESKERRHDGKNNGLKKDGEKKKEDGEEEKKPEVKKEGEGEEKSEEVKKEGEGEVGEKMDDSEEVKEKEEKMEVKEEEKKEEEEEKMEVDGGEKEKKEEEGEGEKVAENGDKKAVEESVENSEEYLKKMVEITELLKKSVECHNLDKLSEADDVVIDDLVAGMENREQWKEILTVALERHRSGLATTHIWPILTGGPFELSCCLEDFYKRDLPVGAELTMNLRRRIYGILLMEKPLPAGETCHKVLEWCVDRAFRNNPQPKHLEAWMPKGYDHPGLLALWNSSAEDEEMQNKRWSLFTRSISTNIDINEVKKLEPFLVAPTMALKYMVENLGYYQDWEIKVLVALALRVHSTPAEELQAGSRKSERTLERPVRLASLYMRLQGLIVFLISALNGPISLVDVLPWNNFDGKLFQFLYASARQNCIDSFLCNKNEKHLEQYNAILKLVLPIRPKGNFW
ncbi:constitutive coactivator of peroxisome proliferator-activated receptor gamma isoform X2 [Nilaparvata lugens]|uniref:constitutive coactivator of peroxisome proliferator-activated receptor gamma isoform X1 n=1 Tax=Nilaparvata lugens TaxID=108931 RepID=UPI00193CABA0|nr:constitutive coactivator of peroxisome proliferator-activated receptor gamma isoform X1 [Nilaparvata lugens]XP_039289300.1 constitutive coactivator of peroxisome proliferator-activated receptor gamma isoform X2 [Nilaparvata lugens]